MINDVAQNALKICLHLEPKMCEQSVYYEYSKLYINESGWHTLTPTHHCHKLPPKFLLLLTSNKEDNFIFFWGKNGSLRDVPPVFNKIL